MEDSLFKVLYEGDVLPGKTQPDVQTAIAQLFGVDSKKLGRLFTGKPRKLKSGLTFDEAKKYVKALAKLGALAFIAPHEEGDKAPDARQNLEEQFTNSGSFNANTFKAHFERLEAKKNQPEADHTILDLDQIKVGKEDGLNTHDSETDQEEESASLEEKTERHEAMPSENDEEWDEKSSIQNVVDSEMLKQLIAEHKN
ncbi:MAG: hypothetical protein EP297_07265 [Gammaproteobacteria bacterium]|nr:MAG: hypothetical protein EP297_07265 [Gammaproteobacteria bacterium]